MLATAIAGTALGLYGQIKSAQANREAQSRLNDQLSTYRTELNRNYLDSNSGHAVLNKAIKLYQNQTKKDANTAAVMGASDESKLAAKSQNQENLNKAISNLASIGERREEYMRENYNNTLNQYNNLLANKSQSAANLASNAGNLISSSLDASAVTSPDTSLKSVATGDTDNIVPDNQNIV